MNEFCEKVKNLIFNNISNTSSEVINNIMNISFNT